MDAYTALTQHLQFAIPSNNTTAVVVLFVIFNTHSLGGGPALHKKDTPFDDTNHLHTGDFAFLLLLFLSFARNLRVL